MKLIPSRRGLARALLVAVLGLVGCGSDPSGPCDREGACQVEGVDLAIEDLRVLGDAQVLHEGVPAFALGDSIEIRVDVRNRGSAGSAPVRLYYCLAGYVACDPAQPEEHLPQGSLLLPSLAPGERHLASFHLLLPSSSNDDILYATAGLDPDAPENPIHNNDVVSAGGVYLINPRIDVTLETAPFRAEVRVNEQTPVVVRVVNFGELGTFVGGLLELCIVHPSDGACHELGSVTLPDLEPGIVTEQTLDVLIPQHVPETIELAYGAVVQACTDSPTAGVRNCHYPTLTLLPDLADLCGTERLDIDGEYTLTGTPPGCDLAGRTGLVGWTFTGIEGNAYHFTLIGPTAATPELLIFNDRGEQLANVNGTTLRFEPTASMAAVPYYHVLIAGGGQFTLEYRVTSAG